MTLANIDCARDAEQAQLAGKVISPLRGGAMLVAIGIGRDKSPGANAMQLLVDPIRCRICPEKQDLAAQSAFADESEGAAVAGHTMGEVGGRGRRRPYHGRGRAMARRRAR